ncbi:hypothetical protein ED733_007855 [Metarhizium rileyi]|uniref:Uncharacterized protein n=1 Tax=Metarhizium rileyi (strain RCEF 4871) TaxID=1649241 RepID=A0A5C6GIU7_METRR|nr:hypothetical protein ED733_007855 [Metarhizium rileyi]
MALAYHVMTLPYQQIRLSRNEHPDQPTPSETGKSIPRLIQDSKVRSWVVSGYNMCTPSNFRLAWQ